MRCHACRHLSAWADGALHCLQLHGDLRAAARLAQHHQLQRQEPNNKSCARMAVHVACGSVHVLGASTMQCNIT